MNVNVKEWLSRLIAFDTTSRVSNLQLIEAIAGYLSELGITHQLIYNSERSKANLYARIGPVTAGGVMLSGHTDVVPAQGQVWQMPPFQLTEQQGRYYGRGTADMKGFIACVLAALPDFLTAPLHVPLHLAFSYDEEVGCLGVRSLIDAINDQPCKPALCIVGEPTGMRPVFGHKGKAAMRCHVRGHACHSAYAPEGVNAVEYAARLISHMCTLAETLKQHQDSRFSPPFSTLHTGVICGGNALNIVPAECSFDFELRHLPDSSPQATLDAITGFARQQLIPQMKQTEETCDIRFTRLSEYPGLCTDVESVAARQIMAWSGVSDAGTVPYGTEGGLFHEAGIPTLVCGPGNMDQGHKPDEYVAIDQLDQCSAMLQNLCQWMQSSD
ncbi:acetylornithine deacetylase [Tatumella terrea]|uniref:acetylornithine deacetylase n=1 Tax=Tatumella terrea TaxID=419007 RepID=UPI0031D3E295